MEELQYLRSIFDDSELDNIMIRMIRSKAFDLNKTDSYYGRTMLHNTTKKDIIQALLESGADPNIVDKENMTPLDKVLMSNRFSVPEKRDIMLLLISYGAVLNQTDTSDIYYRLRMYSPEPYKLANEVIKVYDAQNVNRVIELHHVGLPNEMLQTIHTYLFGPRPKRRPRPKRSIKKRLYRNK
jgi:ankyrin repeat protein